MEDCVNGHAHILELLEQSNKASNTMLLVLSKELDYQKTDRFVILCTTDPGREVRMNPKNPPCIHACAFRQSPSSAAPYLIEGRILWSSQFLTDLMYIGCHKIAK